MGLPRQLKGRTESNDVKCKFTFKMMLKDLFSASGRRLPIPKISKNNNKTIINIDLTQLKKDLKEIEEIVNLVKSKKKLLEKYNISIQASALK